MFGLRERALMLSSLTSQFCRIRTGGLSNTSLRRRSALLLNDSWHTRKKSSQAVKKHKDRPCEISVAQMTNQNHFY
eukprot:1072637-Pleurochrysis_carterae.AAC.1